MQRTILPVPFDAEPVDISAADHVFSKFVDSIYVGGGGALVVRFRGGTEATYQVIPGLVLFGDFERVVKSGTTATSLVGQIANPDRR
jgi:hypothetical protein